MRRPAAIWLNPNWATIRSSRSRAKGPSAWFKQQDRGRNNPAIGRADFWTTIQAVCQLQRLQIWNWPCQRKGELPQRLKTCCAAIGAGEPAPGPSGQM